MARNPRFDVLFEPVRIGPVTAPNRFYQVPHASGMTNALPQVRASFRETKAEGGWGVVCTGAVSIHPSSDDSPLPFASLWDERDIRAHALMTDAVHRHGALAGVELWHGGACTLNRTSRIAPLSPSGMPWMSTHLGFMGNLRPRAMDTADIQDLLRWQAAGARRAMQAGFDIVYVYAGMGYLPYEFLLPEYNRRTDAYGGSIENRVRLVREMLAVTRDAVGDKCAVALRISMEELRGKPGKNAASEAHEVVTLLADIPDLWDVKMDSSPTDCAPSRFSPEGSHEPIINFVKQLTQRPVVGVGRFTSPDVMVSQVRRGILDLIGGARPSIADPFLPNKINEGREHEIRECIGCNICISSWHDGVPVRCTQNPTAGEEWRRDWHPERFAPPGSDSSVLIVGGGPAGLECATTLARRGYTVTIADSAKEFGGRLRFEIASRRDFLRGSSAALVGTALASSLSITRSAHAAGDDTIKIALIGCGGRGSGAAKQALSTKGNVKLIAMADAFRDRLDGSLNELNSQESVKDRIDVPEDRKFVGFDAYEKALAAGPDLVILATPPGFRPIHFEAAVKAGKHIFMEKPVATDAPGVRRVLAAAEESKKKNLAVGVGLQRHHQNVYLETIKRLQDGAIGDIVDVRVYWNGSTPWVHRREDLEAKYGRKLTEMEYQLRNWYYFTWICGDHIVEQHIHNMDVGNWLKNAHPIKANGMGGCQVRKGKQYGETFDHHAVEFEYADGSRMFSQCRHIPNCWNSVSEHAHGTKGTANLGRINPTGGEAWRYRGVNPDPYQVEHDDLFASIRAGQPLNEAEAGAHSTMTAIMGRMCTYGGQELTWDQALNSQISLAPDEFSFDATPKSLPDANGLYPLAVPGLTKVV